MRQPPMRQPACSRWQVITGWVAAMTASSALFIVAIAAAGAPAEHCGRAPPHFEAWEMVLLLALPALPLLLIMLDVIVWYTHRGEVRWKRHLEMAPSLFVVFLVCAFTAGYVAGWLDVCDTATLSNIAALASVGAVLSSVMFGVYLNVCRTPGKGWFWNITVLAFVITATALVYYVLQVVNDLEPLYEAARQLLVPLAMVGMAMIVGIFSAEYSKNRRQSLKWTCMLLVALIAMGVTTYIASGVYGRVVGDTADIHLYVVQTMWAGVTLAGAMLGVWAMLATRGILAEPAAAKWRPISHWVWLAPTMVLAGLAPSYHDISDEWVCLTSMDRCEDPPGPVMSIYGPAGHDISEHGTLRQWIPATVLLAVWNTVTAMVAAMLGDAVAARVRPERTI